MKEEEIEFTQFTNEHVFCLGSYLSKKAIEKKLPIVINIERNEQTIFRFANDGASKNNEYWIKKKANVVKQFNKSSAFISTKLKAQGVTFKQKYGNDEDYAATPGSVPIKVKHVGIVAIISVSGLDSDSDHAFIMAGIKHIKTLEKRLGE